MRCAVRTWIRYNHPRVTRGNIVLRCFDSPTRSAGLEVVDEIASASQETQWIYRDVDRRGRSRARTISDRVSERVDAKEIIRRSVKNVVAIDRGRSVGRSAD